MLQQNNINNSYFAPNSRYYGLEIAIQINEDGTKIPYVKRRFIGQEDKYQVVTEHQVADLERLDNIAQKYLGDPELFWRICDANAAMHPNELTEEVGRIIKIALPEGFEI
ncbi:MAG: LysM domain-containing protein [Saprospiraceae bacterium]|nr:LysM domain-containing protein [Saprospiraceae bacterium]